MSERPLPAGAAEPRLRHRLLSRLRDMPIWSKLGVIMIVPTLATIIVGTNGLVGHIDTAGNADRARVLANLSTVAGELVHHLQDERSAAVLVLGAGNAEVADERGAGYEEVQQLVDDAERPYQAHRSALTDVPGNFREMLDDIGTRLSGLPQLRTQVSGEELGLTDASASYGELINSLINIRDSSAQLAGEAVLGDRMRAAASISRAKEFLSRQRVVGHEVLIRDAYAPQLRTAFIGTLTGQEQALEAFDAVASDSERALLDQTLAGPDVRQSLLYRDYLESLEGENLGTPPWDAQSWDAVLAAHADLLRSMEQQLDRGVVADATALRDAVTQRVLVETGLLLAMLLLAILLAWLVARSMARSLRDLRQGALSVAQYGLPQAVARLRDPNISTQLSPGQVASQIAEPLPVRSKDEFGQVAEAFNTVHLEAVRTAAEQAQLRSSVATMFVNLARRSQILVDRLIGHLDRLERGEEDPDRLAELFQLDHLATRMRRNDENLLVLAGADSTRVQRDPAGLIDVLRAAQSEVEHYTRIEFGVVDRDLEVAAHAVNDLVHLVAELFDNATAFSPPDSHVIVEARRVGDRAVLYVEDRGLGMSAEQLAEANERLATPPQVDVTISRMMGLVVVSRLASRHGVKVELRRASERGTVADVTLPTSVLVPRAMSGRLGGPASTDLRTPPPVQTAPQRPPSPSLPPAPLALESGRPAPMAPAQSGFDSNRPPAPSSRRDHPRSLGRSLPAWSDLTGAAGGPNGTEVAPSGPVGPPARPPAPSAPPLPQRRPSGARGDGQQPAGLDPSLPTRSGPMPGDHTRGGAPADAPTAQHHQVRPPDAAAPPVPPPAVPPEVPKPAAPPVWPPVAPTSPAATPTNGAPAGGGPPAGSGPAGPATAHPGRPAEVPHPRSQAQPATPYTPPQPAPVPVADQTMELPIFTELESVWFRSARRAPDDRGEPPASAPAPAPAPTPAPAPPPADRSEHSEYATVSAGGPTTGNAAMGDNAPDGGSPVAAPVSAGRADDAGAGGSDWRTAADDGWRAASTVAEAKVTEVTQAGLPKRQPMAQLVPGGVGEKDTVSANAQRRTPEAVRGLLSAYHRGVQRGRKHNPDGGGPHQPQSTQAGKEHEA